MPFPSPRAAARATVTAVALACVCGACSGVDDQGGAWKAGEEWKIDESRFPKTQPVIFDFFTSDDGHLWVIPMRGRVADVFTLAGTYLGEVAFPHVLPSPAPAIRGNLMAAADAGADGVPGVRIFRIERPTR